jgi:polar amino acid transport system substrate-binding protein
VGITPAFAPLIYKERGEYRGLEADLARRFAAQLGRTARFVEVRWEDQIPALTAGRTDIIMSGMTATLPRATQVNFTRAYLRSGQSLLVRHDQAARVRLFLTSGKFRVGVQKATTGDFYVQQQLRSSSRVLLRDPVEGAKAVIDKRVDVFVHDLPVVWWLAGQHEQDGLTVLPVVLTDEALAWAVRKDDAPLLSAANAFLEKAASDGSLQQTIDRWLPRFQKQ